MPTLEKKLKDKYNAKYNKIFDKEFRETVRRADQSRKILSKTNISSQCVNFLIKNGD